MTATPVPPEPVPSPRPRRPPLVERVLTWLDSPTPVPSCAEVRREIGAWTALRSGLS